LGAEGARRPVYQSESEGVPRAFRDDYLDHLADETEKVDGIEA